MKKIYLLRHGETAWNAEGRLQGHSDIPLNDQGRRQAQSMMPIMRQIIFDTCYTSDLSRASQTAALALQNRSIPLISEPRLRERNFGFMNGMQGPDIEHLKKIEPHRFITLDKTGRQIAKDAESETEFTSRLGALMKDLEEQTHDNILLVTHGGVIRQYIRLLTPYNPIFQPSNCGLYLFTRGENGKYNFESVHLLDEK